MTETNPRFPHTLVVKRTHRDANGDIVYDNSGNVTYDVVTLSLCALSNGKMLRDSSGNPIIGSTVQSVKCGYRTENMSAQTGGDVVTYTICLHCPPFTTELLYDDALFITDYERTYEARLIRKITFNWGTNIWFEEVKN